jgi:hypothetical protein
MFLLFGAIFCQLISARELFFCLRRSNCSFQTM